MAAKQEIQVQKKRELEQTEEATIPARVFVRGRGLESEWIGNLRVAGTANDPKIVGRLEIRRGGGPQALLGSLRRCP